MSLIMYSRLGITFWKRLSGKIENPVVIQLCEGTIGRPAIGVFMDIRNNMKRGDSSAKTLSLSVRFSPLDMAFLRVTLILSK